jgi:hypothetical protein
MWLILLPFTLGIIWIRWVTVMEPQFSYARLLHGAGPAAIIIIIVSRLIRNAIKLRYKCNIELTKKLVKPQIDPTISFIGEAWWRLPATVGASLASIWALLEFLGIDKLVFNLIR